MGTELTPANQKQPSQCLTQATTSRSSAEQDLRGCGEKRGTAELMACLTLVAPSGMSAEDRKAWVAVARQTLSGIPADLLSRGCAKARAVCKFASEIVPTILEDANADWAWRKRRYAGELAQSRLLAPPSPKHVLDRRGEPMSEDDTAKLNEILANLGASFRYNADGSRFEA